MVHIKTNTSKFKYVNNTSKVRKTNVAEKYQGIRSSMLKPTAYKDAAGNCWYIYKYLIGHDPGLASSTNYYKRRR